jgi:2',3'-cyclic-nucleotide 2'-phosphodiesterase (5'-nucleotidase family)
MGTYNTGMTRTFFATALLLALPSLSRSGPGDTKTFTLLHTNDQHGHLLPFSYPDRISPSEDVARMPFTKDIGGIARRATLVKKLKAETKNCFLIDAGDCMDGTPFSVEFLAKADYECMNAVGYDFGVFGNHDYNMTPPQFEELKKTVKFPLLLANGTNKSDGKNPFPPYVIVNWDGLKIALFGLVTKSTESYTAAKALYKIDDPIDTAAKLVPELRKQADLVIGITHIGLEEDRELARRVSGIDVIVGAHSHTRLPVGVFEITNRPGPGDPKGTVIVQDHQWCGELGRLDLTVMQGQDGRWRVSRFAEQLIPITKNIPEDPAVAARVTGYWAKIKPKYDRVLGEALGDFTDSYDGLLEPTNYHLVADAVQSVQNVDFDLENRAGVRAALTKGKITEGDLISMDPFDNTVFTFQITGQQLKKLLIGSRPISSANLKYALRKNERKWEWVSGSIKGKPIEDTAVYTGATSTYFFTRFVRRVATNGVDTGKLRRDLVREYIKKNSPLKPVEDKRNDFGGSDPSGF